MARNRRRPDRPQHAPSLEQLLSQAQDYFRRVQQLHADGVALQHRLMDLEAADADAKSWQLAERYVERFDGLAILRFGHVPSGREASRFSRAINRDLRAADGYEGPGGSWLSHALRLYHSWPELFGAGTKQARYDDYRVVVTSSLVAKQKCWLRR